MFHHFFGGEGGVNTDRDDRPQPVRPDLRVRHPGLLPDRGLDADRRRRHVLPDHDAARPHGECLPRQLTSARSSSATTRASCASCNSRCPASSPASAAGCIAITYEIVTFDAVAAPLSANALLMAYIGGATTFCRPGARRGPDHAAAERRQPDVEFLAGLCRRAVHRHGDLRADRPRRASSWRTAPIARAGRLSPAGVCPICASCRAGPDVLFGFVGLVELLSFLTIGCRAGQASRAVRPPIDIASACRGWSPLACLLVGGVWLRKRVRAASRASGTT